MTNDVRKTSKGPAQIHAPLKAWFDSKQAEPAPEHLVALVDELETFSSGQAVKKAG